MWTGTKIRKSFEGGRVSVAVQFVESISGDSFEEVYRATAIPADWPDSDIRGREAQLNAIDISKLVLGLRADAPTTKIVAPTQDQLDQDAFTAALKLYQTKKSQLAAGVDGVLALDVSNAAATMKALYKPAYASLLVGVF